MSKLKRKPDGLGRSKTYLGKVPVPAKVDRKVGDIEGVDKKAALEKLNFMEIRFLQEYAKADGTKVRAMLALFPKLKYHAAYRKSWRWMKKIDEQITVEEKFALMGVTTGLVGRVLREAADANFQKEFVNRDGEIVAGAVHPDHQIRLDAIKVAAKVIGLDKVDTNPAISVQIVNFAPPGSTPWPSSGAQNPEIDVTPGGEEI